MNTPVSPPARILVIEDEEDLRILIADLMDLEGFEVHAACNGREGVQMARAVLPHLIISDVMMPELDGYGVLRAVRQDPALSLVPFIFLTAKAERGSIRRGMALGADDYLTKPFDTLELVEAVRSRLRKQEALRTTHEGRVAALRHTLSNALPHELRTPLVGIIGLAELLRDSFETMDADLVRELLDGICQSGWRLERLVDNILHYTLLSDTAGSRHALASEAARVAPEELGGDAADRIATAAERTNDLHIVFAPALVAVSERHFVKLVTELVDNACKFSQVGTMVEVKGDVQQGAYVLRVVDRGRGMTADQITQIAPFVQFDRETFEQQGLGLGLVLCQQLAATYGGHLHLQSTPHLGTTVTVTLPLAPEVPTEAAAPAFQTWR